MLGKLAAGSLFAIFSSRNLPSDSLERTGDSAGKTLELNSMRNISLSRLLMPAAQAQPGAASTQLAAVRQAGCDLMNDEDT